MKRIIVQKPIDVAIHFHVRKTVLGASTKLTERDLEQGYAELPNMPWLKEMQRFSLPSDNYIQRHRPEEEVERLYEDD